MEQDPEKEESNQEFCMNEDKTLRNILLVVVLVNLVAVAAILIMSWIDKQG